MHSGSYSPRVSALAVLALSGVPCGAEVLPSDALSRALAATVSRADAHRGSLISEVRSVRRYVLQNHRWKTDGNMEVRMITDEEGKRFEILSMRANGIQKRAFMRLLEGEVTAGEKQENGLLTAENYDVKSMADETCNGRRCAVFELIPLKKTKHTIEGRAWVDPLESAVMRIEGRSAKSASFWVGRPYVIQEFRKVGDFWFSARHQSTSDVKFLGKTKLTIDYMDYAVVQKTGQVLTACGADGCSPHL